MPQSPTSRTLQWCRDQGWDAGVVERWIPQARRRIDLFGFIDIIAIRSGVPGVVGIQATSGSNVASRVRKIQALAVHKRWLECGNEIWVVGWREVQWRRKDGTKAKRRRWEPRIVNMAGGRPPERDFSG